MIREALHRAKRHAAAPVLGVSAVVGMGLSAYQVESVRADVRATEARFMARLDRLEERLWDRSLGTAETQKPRFSLKK